ncbi:ATP-binding protein [Pseudobutyrivibrio xylanivorans]|uniref:ATP-binding protein n=1 Tax=Pseudobutyrivibrio xylanivorans TaxID=185007 RepID=A0A5P6VLW1_PSEXY|nr:ATP-binding protein [Pseudobutyrivibrio xylanivorans]QFJ53557.1 ATP-binding protein [Pseudobutyrivibrio xylanivorans]
MYEKISRLLMYGDLTEESILYRLGRAIDRVEAGDYNKREITREINAISKSLLMLATDYGFDDNLWHNYIAYYIITNENPFSLVTEKTEVKSGTVNQLVENDFKLLKEIFDYDFSGLEQELGIKSFTVFTNYSAVDKNKQMYNRNVSEKVRRLSKALENAPDEKGFFKVITNFYKSYGVGMFGLNKAFRIEEVGENDMKFVPINNMEEVVLDDLIGYEYQKQQLIDNTEAFVQGKKANNVLLFGDSGTGKSTSIKAIVNQYYDQGLRMIEIYKHQFKYLSKIIASIKNRNYKYIIYMDDLSFEEHEIEYKFLKAVIEGGVETRPDNILIYATSNRRHLIKETWNDRNDQSNQDDRHHSDTVEEKLSLVHRFGVTISYSKPSQKEYLDIVLALAKRAELDISEDELIAKAKIFEMEQGGLSGRTAQQFINFIS